MEPYAVVTDIHIDNDNIPEVEESLEFLLLYLIEHHIELLFILGDIFTIRTGQSLSTLLCFKRILKKLKEAGIRVVMIPGNHDKTALDSEESYLDVFDTYENVEIISVADFVKIDEKTYMALIPYFKEDGNYSEILSPVVERAKKLKAQGKTVFLGTHIAIDEVRNNDGSEVKNSLKKSLFKIFDMVFIGHYHNFQELGSNIWYMASLMPQNFGEDDNKGFIIVSGNTKEDIERIRPPFKRYIKVIIDLDDCNKEEIERYYEKFKHSRHNIRFIFQGSEEQLEQIEKKKFNSVGIDVKKESKVLIKAIKSAEQQISVSYNKASIMKGFVEFCKANEIDSVKRNLGLKYVKGI